MIELEYNKHKLIELKTRLKNIGDSLWHWETRGRNTRITQKNYGKKFLEWQKKFEHCFIKIKKNAK